MGEDPNREIRTMVLLTLPYPPLPVLGTRVEVDDGRLHGDELTTSHSFIARALDEALVRDSIPENKERKKRQLDVFQRFLHAMATEGFSCSPDRLYSIYCQFTFEHIATYFPVRHPIDIRFEPLSSITKGDKTHTKMAEYMASQSVLFEDAVRIRRYEYIEQDYADMMKACRDRLGHVMTDEERAMLPLQRETSGL
jgi:hypothetical protein